MTSKSGSAARAKEVRQKIDAIVETVVAAGAERDDFDAIAAREIQQLQSLSARRSAAAAA